MKKIFLIVIATLFITLITVSIIYRKDSNINKTSSSDNISIVTTLFPIYDITKNIGGDKVDVTLILPPGIEPHAYEPTPRDMLKINTSDIFIYTGEFMEPWAHDIIESTNNIHIVDSSKNIDFIEREDVDDDHNADIEDENKHEHHHGNVDPHIWLDFDNVIIMAKNILLGLQEVDSQNYQYYQDNFESYKNQIIALDNLYQNSLADCQSRTILYGGHYAFGYLAKRYGLDYIAAQGFSPNSEPTAKDMINLVDQIKENHIDSIFYEKLTSPKIAETLANETNAKMLLLNGAPNLSKDDYNSRVSFISIMKDNLNNLTLGLQCKNYDK